MIGTLRFFRMSCDFFGFFTNFSDPIRFLRKNASFPIHYESCVKSCAFCVALKLTRKVAQKLAFLRKNRIGSEKFVKNPKKSQNIRKNRKVPIITKKTQSDSIRPVSG
ncbi:hypothetical protein XENTR_v10024410 [Xenopus tropicalis]|nr:hypothetical protein XENTR_v10024410 [Xenopus tropicalis]